MGKTVYRVTGGALATTVLALGCAVSVLLYFAGDTTLQIIYPESNTYVGEDKIIRRRMPTDDFYGELILRAWIVGIGFMLPGVTGVLAALFYVKCMLVIHTVVSVPILIIGSFLYTGGTGGIVAFHLISNYYHYQSFMNIYKDCQFIRDDYAIPYSYVDNDCVLARKAMIMFIAAVALMFITWIFILSDLLFRAFTSYNISKPRESKPQRTTPEQPSNRGEHPRVHGNNGNHHHGQQRRRSLNRERPPQNGQSETSFQSASTVELRPGPSGLYPVAAIRQAEAEVESVPPVVNPSAPVQEPSTSADTGPARGEGDSAPLLTESAEGNAGILNPNMFAMNPNYEMAENERSRSSPEFVNNLQASVNLDNDQINIQTTPM